MLDTLRSDLHFAGRMLRKSPLFTIVAVACISIGSGAVATIFSVMNAMVLRPLPAAADATRLVRLERRDPAKPDEMSASYPYYEYLRDHARSLDGLVAWSKVSLSLRAEGSEMGTTAYGNFVSGNFFSVLGVRPVLGRFFVAEEDRTDGTHPVIVVSEHFWRVHLGADGAAIGKAITVNGHPFTLVGVAPTEFQGTDAPIQTDAWIPLHMRRALFPIVGPLDNSSATWLRLGARLKPGMTVDVAHRELAALTMARGADGSEPKWMEQNRDVRVSPLTGLPPDASGPLAQFLGMLLAAASLVLLIASVNVASMISARAMERRREMALRAALGAARGRLIRQLLTEMLVLFALGAAAGIGLAYGATAALERLPIPGELQFAFHFAPDARVFGVAIGVSLLIGLLVGLAPAMRAARVDVATRLRDGAAGASARRTFMANSLVIGQLALSMVLLVGAGLFVRALDHGHRIDPGFDSRGVATLTFDASSWGYDDARARSFFGRVRERIASLPGVTATSYTSVLPLSLHGSVDNIRPEGVNAPDGVPVHQLQIDDGYFSVLKIPLIAGREIAKQDDETSAPVAVVNQALAKQFWPDGSALGRTFTYAGKTVTIVGIARDAKYESLNETTPPFVYMPIAQFWRPRQSLMVRTLGDPGALAPRIQEVVGSIDASLPRPSVITLHDAMALGLIPQRVAAMITGILGGAGLLLASVGLYGVIAYSVSRRTREIGIRLALGARAADVLQMVMSEGMRLVATGAIIGLLLAGAASRLITSFLFGVSPLDAVTFGGMALMLVVIGLGATLLPARRAASANPMVVLRAE